MLANADMPTHKVTHSDGWITNIYISDTIQGNLKSKDAFVRSRAQRAVAAAFRDACRINIREFNRNWISWSDILEVRALNANELARIQYDRKKAEVEASGRECDECPRCEDGVHEQCRSGNCPQSYA